MVAIEDIKDRESLQAWLEETNQPREACVALAARASLRVLPLVWARAQGSCEISPLPLLRVNLVASIGGLVPSEVLSVRGDASPLQAAAYAADANVSGYASVYANASTDGHADLAYIAGDAAAFVAAGYASADIVAYIATAADASWPALRSDCARLAEGGNLTRLPLFADTRPDWFDRAFSEVRAAIIEQTPPQQAIVWQDSDGQPITWTDNGRPMIWMRESERSTNWTFWLDWYERFVEGNPQNWSLLLEIATQDDAFWRGSDDEINARIDATVAGYWFDDLDSDTFAAAEAKSPNAERVEKTVDDLYDVVPVTEIAPDPFALAVQRARNTLADIGKLLADPSAQYYALREVADLVGVELDRSSDAPMLVYEALMQAILDLDHLSEVGELPPSDRRIERFRNQFNNSALDILLNDREVRDAVTARAAFKISRLSPEEANQVRVLADALARHSTRRLGDLLRRGSINATSEEVSEEIRRIAIYEYGSRTIRMYGVDKETFNSAANAASISGFINMVIGWFG